MKDIPGYEGLYSITTDGRVYSHIKKRFLNPKGSKEWYIQVRLCKNKIQKPFRLHTLVAIAFLPNPEGLPEINHINGIKTDNRLENLEWTNRSNNIKHSYQVLKRTPVKGSKHPKHRLILDLQTGIYYDSSAEAAEAKGIDKTKLLNNIRARQYKVRRAPFRYGMMFV